MSQATICNTSTIELCVYLTSHCRTACYMQHIYTRATLYLTSNCRTACCMQHIYYYISRQTAGQPAVCNTSRIELLYLTSNCRRACYMKPTRIELHVYLTSNCRLALPLARFSLRSVRDSLITWPGSEMSRLGRSTLPNVGLILGTGDRG